MTTAAAGALCSTTITCASSGCCSFISKTATVATGDANTTTNKYCVAAGTAANAAASVTAVGASTTTSVQGYGWFTSCTSPATSCSAFNGATACAAAKAGSSTLVASAAAVATAVYMM